VTERIFAVSIMGFTRCYKNDIFNSYVCSFSTKFTLQMYTEAILEYYFWFRFLWTEPLAAYL